MTDRERAVPTNVTLYDADRAIIGRMQERYGMNFSAAIRAILADWDRNDRREVVFSKAGHSTDGTDLPPPAATGARGG